jgi:DnaJ-class molecular chaperone
MVVMQPDAAERFMECKMAYQLLIDPSKRQQYDRQHQVLNTLLSISSACSSKVTDHLHGNRLIECNDGSGWF